MANNINIFELSPNKKKYLKDVMLELLSFIFKYDTVISIFRASPVTVLMSHSNKQLAKSEIYLNSRNTTDNFTRFYYSLDYSFLVHTLFKIITISLILY